MPRTFHTFHYATHSPLCHETSEATGVWEFHFQGVIQQSEVPRSLGVSRSQEACLQQAFSESFRGPTRVSFPEYKSKLQKLGVVLSEEDFRHLW
jgi:hypothetical protein